MEIYRSVFPSNKSVIEINYNLPQKIISLNFLGKL